MYNGCHEKFTKAFRWLGNSERPQREFSYRDQKTFQYHFGLQINGVISKFVSVLGPGDPYALASGPAQAKSFTIPASPFTLNSRHNVKFCVYRASVQATLTVKTLSIPTGGEPVRLIEEEIYTSPPIGARPHEWFCVQRPIGPGYYRGVCFGSPS